MGISKCSQSSLKDRVKILILNESLIFYPNMYLGETLIAHRLKCILVPQENISKSVNCFNCILLVSALMRLEPNQNDITEK